MNNVKRKFNSIDFIIIIATIVCLVILASTFFGGNRLVDISKKQKVLVTVTLSDLPTNHAGLITKNTAAFATSDKTNFGKVTQVDISGSNISIFDEASGVARTVENPDMKNATVTVDLDASIKGDKIEIDGKTYTIGDVIEFSQAGFSSTAVIESIQFENEVDYEYIGY